MVERCNEVEFAIQILPDFSCFEFFLPVVFPPEGEEVLGGVIRSY